METDFEEEQLLLENEEYSSTAIPVGQTPLPIYTPQDPASRFANYLSQWLMSLRRRSETVQFNPAWTSEGFAFATGTTAVINIFIFMACISFFGSLPPYVRFFYNSATDQGILVEKTLVLISPILLLVLQTIALRLTWEIYKLDDRLANVISWIITLINFVNAIAAVQLFSIALGL
jgi:hypothetical protein